MKNRINRISTQVDNPQPPALVMSKETVIRTRTGSRLGHIVDDGDQLVARDRLGRRLGAYDAKKNATYDKNSNRLAEGNILPALILQAQDRS